MSEANLYATITDQLEMIADLRHNNEVLRQSRDELGSQVVYAWKRYLEDVGEMSGKLMKCRTELHLTADVNERQQKLINALSRAYCGDELSIDDERALDDYYHANEDEDIEAAIEKRNDEQASLF